MGKVKKILVLLVILLININLVNASSFSINASSNLTKGGTTKLTISGSDVIGRFNIKTSNSSVVSISEDRAWIENNSYSITLRALSVGKSTITVTPTDVSNSNGGNPGIGAKSITINVSLPREKSNNNSLKGLSVEGFELVPAFDKDNLEYNVSVPSTTEKIKINATKADNYSSVSGTGEFEVQEGINSFEVISRSETGKEKVYTVIVTVEDLNPIEVTSNNKKLTVLKTLKTIEIPENFIESSASVNGITVPSYHNEKNNITLVGLKDESGNNGLYVYDNVNKYTRFVEIKSGKTQFMPFEDQNIKEGYIKTTIDIDGEQVNVYKLSKESKFSLIYGLDITNSEKGYYSYDEVNKTIQKFDDELLNVLEKQNNNYKMIIYISAAIIFIFLLLVIIFASGNSKKKKLITKYLEKHDAIPKVVEHKETKKEKKAKQKYKEEQEKELEKTIAIAINNEILEEKPTKKKKKDKVEEKVEESKEETKENSIEEITEEEETYNIFEDDKKSKKKKK